MERRVTSHTEEEEMNQRRKLLTLARKGDEKAINKLFELYQVKIYTGELLKKVKTHVSKLSQTVFSGSEKMKQAQPQAQLLKKSRPIKKKRKGKAVEQKRSRPRVKKSVARIAKKVKPKVKPKPKTKPKLKANLKTKPRVKSKAKPRAKIKSKTQTQRKVKPKQPSKSRSKRK